MNKINFFILSLMVLINVLLFSQDYEYEIFKLIDNNSISEIKNKVLNKEININFKNKYEETPLLYAIKTNASNEIIKYLINSGVSSYLFLKLMFISLFNTLFFISDILLLSINLNISYS